jgi:hypothetical protein
MKLYPFADVSTQADADIQDGATVYQQFNCAGCGIKQTMETPNIFYRSGQCETCGHITNIAVDGCNYLLMKSRK